VQLPSRRQRAAERQDNFNKQIETLQKTVGESQKNWEQRMSTLAEENARLRGTFETLIPVLQQRQQPQNTAPQRSPADIRREAQKALDAGRFDEWQESFVESIVQQVRPMIPQQQAAPAAPGPSPIVQAMLMQHPGVVNSGQRGIDLAIAEDNRLAVLGHQPGPERFKKAFEMAEAHLTGKAQQGAQQTYSQNSRGALAGITRDKSAGKGADQGPGVELTAYELEVCKKAGMTKSEYAAYIAQADPSRLRNG
jgi:hypothetical protein